VILKLAGRTKAAMADRFIEGANAAGVPLEVLHRVASMASGGGVRHDRRLLPDRYGLIASRQQAGAGFKDLLVI
jgi:hypothetical protein